MREHVNNWHTSHMAENTLEIIVLHVRNRTNGQDARIVVHKNACAMCAAHLCDLVWGVEAMVKAQNAGSPASPTGHPI